MLGKCNKYHFKMLYLIKMGISYPVWEKEIIFSLYEYGYFDPERKMSLTQIAEQMDISTAALSEILRKTLRKIVKDYVESKL